MALKQKILVNESAYDEKIVFCESVCDDIANLHRICPPVCAGFCPPDCTLENLEIPPPPPPPPLEPLIVSVSRGHTLPLGLTVCFAVLATTFFLFTCFTIYKFYSYWRNSRRRSSERRRSEEEGGPDDFLDEEHGPIVDHPIWYIRTIGLQPSVISAITVVRFKRGDGLIDGADCAVCLSEFEEDETLRLLPKCNHAFHIPCIDTWLRSHTTCPLCRAGIVNSAAAAAAATPSPSPELAVQNSGPSEENHLEIAVGESAARYSENEASREDRITRSESGFKMDDSGGLGLQSVRRSVSVDSVSASMISAAVARAFPNNQLVEDSSERSGNYWMKRSVSCSSKALSSSRHQNSQ